MGKILLEGLTFKANHGYHEEERLLGGQFEVNIAITTDFRDAAVHDELSGTVDYEILYKIIKEEMDIPAKLLEHVSERITNRVIKEIKEVKKVKVSLAKFNAPIGGDCRAAIVSMKKKRS